MLYEVITEKLRIGLEPVALHNLCDVGLCLLFGGSSVYQVRKRLGRQLAMEGPADADIVV